eukprot:CAMPEP_0116136770 /NCGR_PEP_ID=MMETSP0329-20121206/11906_1 /TAXON_ID=697910 /ORGANISM="Pseudo-nitzschia arenysensis, Strain B593" /LENGTH=448 /DNA_ID=CAMNT_0003631669 /DNA_START=145 /DNA_END=1491 /DNA_ORIENTATION=+
MLSFGSLLWRNFRSSPLAFLSMVLLVLLGFTNASIGRNGRNGNNNVKLEGFDIYDLPAIQWACQPFLDASREFEHPLKEKTKELCAKLRGGKLGKGIENDLFIIEESGSEVGDIRNNSSDEINVELLEKEEAVEEDFAEQVDPSPVTTTFAEKVELMDEISITSEESEASPSLEQHYVPSHAPTASTLEKYTFSLFQENDGHETDPDGIPTRYITMQGGRRDLAKAAMEKTVAWRKENDIDTILARPHPKYDISKAAFPHYFCGRDDTQHVILLQRPGLINMKLAGKNNLTGEELLFHYIYVMEYLWRLVDPAPDATMTSIIDLTELNISILRKREQLRVGSLFLSTMDAHFPQRSHRTFLINAPKWFGALYKLATPLLRESTKEKIQILSKGKEQDEILKDLLRDCPIPEGDKLENVPPGEMEEELRNFCLARLEEAGVEMEPVDPL